MRLNSVVYFTQVIYAQDELGNWVETLGPFERRQTFAEKKSVRQSEYYQAASLGLKPETIFVLYLQEYKGEEKLEFEGKVYTIVRTYERPDGKIELSCEVKLGG